MPAPIRQHACIPEITSAPHLIRRTPMTGSRRCATAQTQGKEREKELVRPRGATAPGQPARPTGTPLAACPVTPHGDYRPGNTTPPARPPEGERAGRRRNQQLPERRRLYVFGARVQAALQTKRPGWGRVHRRHHRHVRRIEATPFDSRRTVFCRRAIAPPDALRSLRATAISRESSPRSIRRTSVQAARATTNEP